MASRPKDELLDNAVWHALHTRHAHFAEGDPSGRAVRFDPEVAFFGAVDALDAEGWASLAALTGPEGYAMLFRDEVPSPPPASAFASRSGWEEVLRLPTWQMVAGRLRPVPDIAPVPLGPEDADEMLALVQLTEPGPFFPRPHEMGSYVGVKREDRLVAMAGERLKLPGWTEVSAVCTHPDARRQGLGAALTLWMARAIRESGDEAFLHVIASNENALRLYQALGFEIRRMVQAVVLKRLPDAQGDGANQKDEGAQG